MLLDEMPIIISYFYFYLTRPRSGPGVETSGMGHVD